MTAIKLDKFGGCLPAWDSRLLPDGQADVSINCYLFSGSLIGWRQPKLLYQLKSASAKYAYRITNKHTNDTSITAPDSFWMEFLDPDTTVMRTPVVNDSFQRYYFASPTVTPKYNTYDRIVNDDPPWLLGVPGSGCTPGVVVSGGGGETQLGFMATASNAGMPRYFTGNGVALVPIRPDGSMIISSVSFIPASSSASLRFQAVVYGDSNGQPYQLLGVGDQVIGVTAGTATSSVITNGVSVISNTQYWVGIAVDEALYFITANLDNRTSYFPNTYSNGPPEFVSSADAHTTFTYIIWANLVGASVFEARAYTYTWVTEYGEEGPPSPPTIVNGWSNGTWTITLWTPEPENMGVVRNITHTRIYRSITSQQGIGTYFLVTEIPVTQATYSDTSDDNIIAFNAQLQSLYWYAPPADLQGIVPFPNGMTIGWKANELWFSEVYRPHAWPPNYVITTEFPIVGVGVCGQSIVVCTQGSPYLVTGVNPGSMGLTKINLPEPCLHRGSIMATDTTVMYVSPNGLIQVSQSGAGANVTEGWISRERWQALTPQRFVRAIKHATSYFAFGSDPDDPSNSRRGFTVELSQQDQISFTIWPQAGGHRLGFSQLTSPNGFDIDNVMSDVWTGVGLLLQNAGVYYYDFTDLNPVIVPYKWRSKTFQQLSRKNFEAMKLWFTVPDSTPTQAAVRNTADPQPTLAADQYAIVRVYTDDELWTTREVRKSGELLRIYSGIKVEQWQFEIEGRVNVSNMQVATSVKELGLI